MHACTDAFAPWEGGEEAYSFKPLLARIQAEKMAVHVKHMHTKLTCHLIAELQSCAGRK